jgi:hypothetical protein
MSVVPYRCSLRDREELCGRELFCPGNEVPPSFRMAHDRFSQAALSVLIPLSEHQTTEANIQGAN